MQPCSHDWRPQIQAAIDHTDGKWSIYDIEQRLQAGTARLFHTEKSCAVVWVDAFPQKRALVVAFAGGVLDDILANIPPIQEYARQLGCSQIDVYGRNGWARTLKNHGFKQTSIIMSRSV